MSSTRYKRLAQRVVALLCSIAVVVIGTIAFSLVRSGDNSLASEQDNTAVANMTRTSDRSSDISTVASFSSNGIGDSQSKNVSVLSSSYPSYGITGTSQTMIRGGDKYDFLSGIVTTPDKSSWVDGDEFRAIVTGVDGESGCSYTYKSDDTSFTPSKNDDGKTYTVHYKLQKKKSGNSTWNDVLGITASKKLTVYSVNERKDEIGDDEGYIKSLAVSAVVDGSSPWDGDDDPGDDSSDSNKIVRTWDTVTYNVAYTTATYELGTSYDNAYVNFCFTLPMEEQEATFNTDAMGWMSTDPTHQWKKENKQDALGKTYQVLTCSKRISNQGSSTSAVPGSGEIYVQITVYAAKNGDKIAPSVKAYMDGNNLADGSKIAGSTVLLANGQTQNANKCQKHGNNELKSIALDTVMISAAPSYNLSLHRGSYNEESSGLFDFSTGDDDAPNKDAGIVRGRLIKYTVSMELRNKSIQSGPDKGKSKYLRGIEIPSGDISYTVDMSSSFLANSGKSYPLDSYDEYKPLLWATSKNTNNIKYRSDLHSVASNDCGIPYDSCPWRTIKNTGLKSPISRDSNGVTWGAGEVWNGGSALKATQSGRKLTLTQNNYEINPIWFPNCLAWDGRNGSYYYNPADGIMKTNRGVFSAAVIYIVVPYGNDDNYLPIRYSDNGTERLTLTEGSLVATSVSGQKVLPVSDFSNQSVTTDDKLTDTVYLTRPGSWCNYIWYSSKSNPCQWYGSGGTGDSYNQSRGSDSVMIGDQIGVYWGFIQYANGEMKNVEQANDVLLKFDDKSFTVAKLVPSATNNIAYAAKKDGNGWTSDDEMNKTNIEDLIYYSSESELKAAGATCVGLMTQWRVPGRTNTGRQDVFSGCVLQTRNDLSLSGHVAQITIETNGWNGYKESSDGSVTALPDVPLRSDVQSGKASEADYAANMFAKNSKSYYYKTEYDADGNATFHTGGTQIGDSALLISYTSKLGISTAQFNENGGSKTIYDLDNNQYSVDYVIRPTLSITAKGGTLGKTTVKITATLPSGLEYEPGSSKFGGTYTPSKTPGYSGTISDALDVTPQVNKDKNGRTTLVWTIPDVQIEETLPYLYFTGKIDSTTAKNVDFQVDASIQTTEDLRAPNVNYGNSANYSIKTAKTSDISIATKAKKSMNEINSTIGYTSSWSNNSQSSLDDQVLMSVTPYNGDSAGSKFNGTYEISSARLSNAGTGTGQQNPNKYEAWYTIDAVGNTITTSDGSNVDATTIRSGLAGGAHWVKTTIGSDGTINLPKNGVTAWCLIGTMPGGASVKADVNLTPSGNASGNRYVNTVWLTNSTTQASCYIVRRMLSGVAWIDWNGNGKRDSEEKKLPGVRVRLTDLNGNTVKNLSGNKCTAITNSDGAYSFDEIPMGTYNVIFDDGGAGITLYRQSVKHADGAASSVNNDAEGQYDSSGVLISGITDSIAMPDTDSIASSPYIVENIDAGYVPIVTLPLSGGSGLRLGIMSVVAFCMSAGITAFVLGSRRGKRDIELKEKAS